jgi:hypothetical protein
MLFGTNYFSFFIYINCFKKINKFIIGNPPNNKKENNTRNNYQLSLKDDNIEIKFKK